MAALKYDMVVIEKFLTDQVKVNKTLQKHAFLKGQEIVHRYRDELIKDFENDRISQEIKAGPTADNTSGTLGGYGNLFSFIGFYKNKPNPVLEVIDFIKANIRLKTVSYTTKLKNMIVYNFPVVGPDKEFIKFGFPVPWGTTSKSWIISIEEGFSNLHHYVYKMLGFPEEAKSRSTTGLQKEKVDTGRVFSPVGRGNYLTKYLQQFIDKIRGVKGQL